MSISSDFTLVTGYLSTFLVDEVLSDGVLFLCASGVDVMLNIIVGTSHVIYIDESPN